MVIIDKDHYYDYSDFDAKKHEREGTQREGTKREIADAVEFLASSSASFVNGTDLLVECSTIRETGHIGESLKVKRLGLDGQTMFGMPPVEHITLAADLGCGHISGGLVPVPWKLDRFPLWSLRDDTGLRREVIATLRDRGIAFALGEGCIVRAGFDVRDYARDLDLFAELGAVQIGTVAMDPDASRAHAQLASLAEMVDQRGMQLTLEFAPPHSINTFEKALSAVRNIAKPNVRLTIDAMHFFRTGSTIDQLARAGGGCIGHVQLCDAPLSPTTDNYYQEASFNRQLPGEGELPLRSLLSAVPNNVRVGLEIPMQAKIQAGTSLETLIARAVALAQGLLPANVEAGTQDRQYS